MPRGDAPPCQIPGIALHTARGGQGIAPKKSRNVIPNPLPLSCDDRQHAIHQHAELHQGQRAQQPGGGGFFVRNMGQAPGQTDQQQQRQHGQEVPPLQP